MNAVKIWKSFVMLSAVAAAPGAAGADPQVDLKTNQGTIRIELNPAKAPKSVENFLQYVKSGHYSGVIFHRVIDGFMIQAGGMDKNMKEKATKAPIENEAKNGLKNDIGTIAMARTNQPHSASAQWFINLKNNEFLNYPGQDGWGYAVFGKVVSGMDVVNKIAKVPTGNAGMHQNVPRDAVVIESATLVEDKKADKK
jgi:cyclophilin family peptidyl-prolyl cis-trans isomerase